jgi:hypothetical protein
MKISKINIIIIFGVFLIGIILVFGTTPIPFLGALGSSKITDDEYEIYSAFINDNKVLNPIYERILISQDTMNSSFIESGNIFFMKADMPSLQYFTYNDFLVRNMKKGRLSNSSLPSTVQVVDDDEIKREMHQMKPFIITFDPQAWENQSRQPVIIRFSRLGFNLDKSQALLYTSMYCGMTCGSSDYYLFSKINGKWSISDRRMIWIS